MPIKARGILRNVKAVVLKCPVLRSPLAFALDDCYQALCCLSEPTGCGVRGDFDGHYLNNCWKDPKYLRL